MSEETTSQIHEAHEDVIKKRARVIFWQRLAIGLLGLYMIASMAFLVWNGLSGAQTRQTLIDCVEPGGKCADRNARQTAKVVQQLIENNQLDEAATRQYVLFTIYCQDVVGVDTINQIQLCVTNQLELRGKAED